MTGYQPIGFIDLIAEMMKKKEISGKTGNPRLL